MAPFCPKTIKINFRKKVFQNMHIIILQKLKDYIEFIVKRDIQFCLAYQIDNVIKSHSVGICLLQMRSLGS